MYIGDYWKWLVLLSFKCCMSALSAFLLSVPILFWMLDASKLRLKLSTCASSCLLTAQISSTFWRCMVLCVPSSFKFKQVPHISQSFQKARTSGKKKTKNKTQNQNVKEQETESIFKDFPVWWVPSKPCPCHSALGGFPAVWDYIHGAWLDRGSQHGLLPARPRHSLHRGAE